MVKRTKDSSNHPSDTVMEFVLMLQERNMKASGKTIDGMVEVNLHSLLESVMRESLRKTQ
jgi:hypothetical protein